MADSKYGKENSLIHRVIYLLLCLIVLSLTGNLSAASYMDDDFENYTTDEDLEAKWTMVYWGGNNQDNPSGVTMERHLVTTGGANGSQAMRMTLTFQSGVAPNTQNLGVGWEPCIYGITGYYLVPNSTDLTSFTGVSLWLKPGTTTGNEAYFKLNIIEDESLGGEKWMSPKINLSNLNPEGEFVFLDFDEFTEYYTGSGQPMDRTSIKISFFFLAYDEVATANSSTTVLVDDIYLVSYMASAPSPDNGAINIGLTPTLLWASGEDANAHDVYFGTDEDAVVSADTSDFTGLYRGRQSLDVISYSPCCLEPETTYYWRIDEVSDTTIWRGTVWHFTVRGPAGTYSNPVISELGPADPAVIFYQGKYYMYPTGDNTSYHVYTSYDLVNWTKGSRIFIPGGINVWAPDIFYHSVDGKFYLYYTANWKIGVATANRPDEVFIDQGILLYNAIDAHLFQDDDGNYYLYFVRTNLDGGFKIFVQEMTNPLELVGNSTMVIEPTEPWEMISGSITEGPWMIKRGDTYYLLYSGTAANTQNYAIGYATSDDPLGPFTKYSGNPIITGGDGVYGPGHGSVITDAAGELWHVYHQKQGANVGWDRFICIDPLWFDSNNVLHGIATRGTSEIAPVIAPPFNDDFENYDSDSTLALKWDLLLWSGDSEDSSVQVAMTRTLDKSGGIDGNQAMKLVFSFNSGVVPSEDTAAVNWDPAIFGIAGTSVNVFARRDLTEFSGIRLWLKRGAVIGHEAYFTMSIVEDDGGKWMSPEIDLNLLNTSGEEVYVPFEDFEEYYLGDGQPMDRTNITLFNLWLAYNDTATETSYTTVWVDNITLEPNTVSVDRELSVLPEKFMLYQNFPNPFNSITTIRFDIPEAGNVQLMIYDILGREVTQLEHSKLTSGFHSTQWDGRDKFGVEMSTGVYLYRIKTGHYTATKKLILLK
ncbi:MAG: family 43 glycosylhydrolase [FCB group bacterium]|nr:family 43 glycosylhydrolase [FCB group bacterium]